jgi:chaperonin cofactor prefoldin
MALLKREEALKKLEEENYVLELEIEQLKREMKVLEMRIEYLSSNE